MPLYDVSLGISPILLTGKEIKITEWYDDTNTGFIQTKLFSNGYPANDLFKMKDKVPMSFIKDGDGYILAGGTISKERTEGSTAWIIKMQKRWRDSLGKDYS